MSWAGFSSALRGATNGFRAPRRLVSLVPSALGNDAALIGAAELAFEPLLADPARWLRPREALLERASA